ncbi:3'-5' exonuclease [Bacillus alkalicellulosilyticus]|uniref:3'-5' exonuclease n=1 Tax=Alkalihalobacterium alkalicellulosilyticum TaxID=1912214 RepID=UPI0009978427|nr:3'-5' exonuclease [Bacillus alkalicellulosilyticus]
MLTNDINQLVFFDFEMLCSNRGMAYEDMEAIRLGAVKYNTTSKTISTFERYIKPTTTSPLTTFCKKLTGITDEDLQDADDFKTVFTEFILWIEDIVSTRFYSWSPSDITRLAIDSKRHKLDATLITMIEKRYNDFQATFTKFVSKDNYSVENALQLFELPFVGEQHNPLFDAYNTLRIYLAYIDQPVLSDQIMLKQYFSYTLSHHPTEINEFLYTTIKQDIHFLLLNTEQIYTIREAKKKVKEIKRLARKYNNIMINRSGLFTETNRQLITCILSFYRELVSCYKEHRNFSSKIMILDDFMFEQFQQYYSKEG